MTTEELEANYSQCGRRPPMLIAFPKSLRHRGYYPRCVFDRHCRQKAPFRTVGVALLTVLALVQVCMADPPAERGDLHEPLVHVTDFDGRFGIDIFPFSGDSNRLATEEEHPQSKSTVRIWDLHNNKLIGRAFDSDRICDSLLTTDGKTLLTASCEDKVFVWDVESSAVKSTLDVRPDKYGGWFSPDGMRFVTVSADVARLRLWRCGEHAPFATLAHADAVSFISFDRSGKRIVTVDQSGNYHLWEADTGREVCKDIKTDYIPDTFQAKSAAFTGDGKQVIICIRQGCASVDFATGQIRTTGHIVGNGFSDSLASNSDGTVIAVVTRRGGPPRTEFDKVQIFKAGRLIHVLPQDSGLCELIPSGRLLITGNFTTKSIDVWDVSSGKQMQSLLGYLGNLAVSPDGKFIAMAHGPKTSLWRVRED